MLLASHVPWRQLCSPPHAAMGTVLHPGADAAGVSVAESGLCMLAAVRMHEAA